MQGGATVVHNSKVSGRRHRSGRTRCPALAPISTLELCWGVHVPAVAELVVSEYKSTLSITQFLRMASLESCEQEASLSTCFDTASHTNTSFLNSKKNSIPPKKMRWIRALFQDRNLSPFEAVAGMRSKIIRDHCLAPATPKEKNYALMKTHLSTLWRRLQSLQIVLQTQH